MNCFSAYILKYFQCFNCLKDKKQTPHDKFHALKNKDPKQLKGYIHSEPNIVIVGAGAAGLACAVELKAHGFESVRILESSGRVGGRIRTMKFADNYVDLGAQWVHGERQNIVFQMAKGKELMGSTRELFLRLEWIRSNGQRLTKSLSKKLLNVMTHIFQMRHKDLAEFNGTFGEYLVDKFTEEMSEPSAQKIDREVAAEFLRTFKKMEGSAVDTDMSAAGFEDFHACHGDSLINFRNKGFRAFLHLLVEGDDMNELGLLKDCVEFNACVTKIDWDRLDGTVQLITDKGITYEADHVVVTVSLGVLKQNPQLFEPRLPLPKLRAINFMGFGTVTKIFVEFNEPFWQDNWPGFNAMWRTDDMYQPQLEWVADIYGFHRYPFQPRVLLGWAAGPHTDTIESIDSKMLAQGVLYMLRRFLPKLKIPQPKLVTTSKWSKDPAYLGGYSYPTLLSKSYNVSAMDLLQPCNLMAYESYELQQSFVSIMPMTVRPILLFAGEATSPHHFSTVHGAVETGLREARRLIGYYMKDNY